MASYEDLFRLSSNTDLRNRVAVAITIEVETLRSAAPTDEQKWWMKQAIERPELMARRMIWALLAANKDATVANIIGATDTTIQTAVSNAVSIFATITEPKDKLVPAGAGT